MRVRQEKATLSRQESGAALLSVVLILGLLSLLTVTVAVYVNSRSTIVAMTREALHQRLLVESALAYAVGRVRSTPAGMPVRGEDRIRLKIGRAQMSWSAESGRLDLNLADPEPLISLFIGAGLKREQAVSFVDQIAMRRALPAHAGAINADKALATGRGGPFEHSAELLTLKGMTTDLYTRLEPFVTVFGSSNKIDPRLASKTLMGTLFSLSSVDLARLEAGRGASDEEMKAIITTIPESLPLFDLQRPQATRLLISIQTIHGTRQTVEIVFLTFDDDAVPYRILEWQEG